MKPALACTTSLVLCVVAALPCRAQLTLYSLNGNSASDWYGYSVSDAGDVNGDGFGDVLIGAPHDDDNGTDSGSATLISGFDGSVIHTFLGSAAGDQFGYSVSGAGDVDNDGVGDVIVGAPFSDENGASAGSAIVFSGASYLPLRTYLGHSTDDQFGYSVSDAGDLNNDGYAEVIIGAPGDDNLGVDSGSARVHSGIDGLIYYFLNGENPGNRFGSSVSDAGDANMDGTTDLVVGAPSWSGNSGRVRVFSGLAGVQLHSFPGLAGATLGTSVSGAGDIDNDGHADIICGGPTYNTFRGMFAVYSGKTGITLHQVTSYGGQFGKSVGEAGDFNNDGIQDIVVGVPSFSQVLVYSGADWSVLMSRSGGGNLGFSVSTAGDITGNGVSDIVAGAYNSGAGSASVIIGQCPEVKTYCVAKVNSLGCVPTMSYVGAPSLAFGLNKFFISAANILNNKPAIMLYSMAGQLSVPFQAGTLCVATPIYRTPGVDSGGNPPPTKDCSGINTIDMTAFALGLGGGNPRPELQVPGTQVNCQWWGRDQGYSAPNNTSLSDGLEYTVCP